MTKFSPDLTTVVWQYAIPSGLSVIATVDPSGGVYLLPYPSNGTLSATVEKLKADGSGIAWQMPLGFDLGTAAESGVSIVADSASRAYVSVTFVDLDTKIPSTTLTRVNAGGHALDYTLQIPGVDVAEVTADSTGSAILAGGGFLMRLSSDGSKLVFSVSDPGFDFYSPVVTSGGNVAVLTSPVDYETYPNSYSLSIYSPGGDLLSSYPIPPGDSLAVDAAGTMYVTGRAVRATR